MVENEAALKKIITTLEGRRERILETINYLKAEIGGKNCVQMATSEKPKRKFSAAARRRMSAGMRKSLARRKAAAK